MLQIGFVLCAVLVVVSGQTTEVSQCIRNDGDLPINSYIADCATPPCDFASLSDAIISIIFRAPHTIRSMRTLATAYLSIGPLVVPISYDLGLQSITCNYLTNTYCPVVADEVIQYTLVMHIEAFFPIGTSTTVEFQVVDENNVAVFCIRVPIRITAALRDGSARNSTLTVVV